MRSDGWMEKKRKGKVTSESQATQKAQEEKHQQGKVHKYMNLNFEDCEDLALQKNPQ